MKKIISIFLTIFLMVNLMPMGLFSITASAEISSGTCGENTYWEYDSSTRTLTISGNGSIKDYTTYYTTIHKKELTRAPWGSLYNDIQIVRINSGVTRIGTNAFYGFQKITTVYLANTVKTIGESAFLYCSSLKNAYYYGTSKEKDSIVIGQYNSSLTNVLYQTSEVIESGKCGDNLVWTLDSLNILTISGTGEMYDYKNNNPWYSKKNQEIFVIIEEGVTSIGAYAFYGCSGFKNIHISDDVTRIGEYAFRNSGFKNIQIPKSVTSIGMAAFRGCSANIEIPESITEMGSYAFSGCSGIKNITIPNNVTTIGQCVFEGSGIESIDIENARISYAAFRDCSELESVNIRNCVDIGGYAFSNCPKLKNITIPDSVTDLGEYAFYKCSGLQSVTIGNGVTEIGNSTFAECTALADITLGNGITKIGEYAFKDCRGIARTVILNDNLITIEQQAFGGCTGLLSITIPDSVTTIGISAFHGCVGLEDVSIGNGVKWIGCNAFAQCTALKKNNYDNAYYLGNQNNPYYYLLEASSSTKKIHNDTKIIGYGAFMEPDPDHYYLFDDLNSITIPFDVISIGDYAFTDCRNLESITIGNQVRLIGSSAFYGTKLKDIYYIGTSAQCDKLLNNLTSVDADCFNTDPTYHCRDCNIDGHFYKNDIETICYVCEFDKSLCTHDYDNDCDAICNICEEERTAPHHFVDAICSICGERDKDIINIGKFISGASWCVNSKTNTLYIYGNGETDNYKSSASVPWYEQRSIIKSVYINSGITKIGNYSFDCLLNLENVYFEMKNISFGYYVFSENAAVSFFSPKGGSIENFANKNNFIHSIYQNPTKPISPELLSKTETSITLKSIDGYEYSIDGVNFQQSNVFDGLITGTEYTFYQRIAENDEYLCSEKSDNVKIRTQIRPTIPSKPTVLTNNDKSVTLIDGENYLYSIDGVNFTNNNTFTNLTENVIHNFYRKSKANLDYTESDSSLPTKVMFLSAPKIKLIGATKVIFEELDGLEYSIDGIEWQTSGVFTRLIPEETYTVYQRIIDTNDIIIVELSVDGTEFITNGQDEICESPNATHLTLLRKALLLDTKDMSCDYNCDGEINIIDLVRLKNFLVSIDNHADEQKNETQSVELLSETAYWDNKRIVI